MKEKIREILAQRCAIWATLILSAYISSPAMRCVLRPLLVVLRYIFSPAPSVLRYILRPALAALRCAALYYASRAVWTTVMLSICRQHKKPPPRRGCHFTGGVFYTPRKKPVWPTCL